MLFCLYCLDKDGHTQLRADNREAHVAYLKAQGARIVSAGPLLSDDGAAMIGSLLILDVEDHTAAEAFATGDPYAKAGLFKSVDIRPWKKVI
jgi:uncharacterized protein YciI